MIITYDDIKILESYYEVVFIARHLTKQFSHLHSLVNASISDYAK